jgi:hypothetical protein
MFFILKLCALLMMWYAIILQVRPAGLSPFLLKNELQKNAMLLPKHGMGLAHAFVCVSCWVLDMFFGFLTVERVENLQLFSATFLFIETCYEVWTQMELRHIRAQQYRMQILAQQHEYQSDAPFMTNARLHMRFHQLEINALWKFTAHHVACILLVYGVGWGGNTWFAYAFWFRETWAGMQHAYSLLFMFIQNACGTHESFTFEPTPAAAAEEIHYIPKQFLYEKDLPPEHLRAHMLQKVTQLNCLDHHTNMIALLRACGVTSAILYLCGFLNFALSLLGAFSSFQYFNPIAYALLLSCLYYGYENFHTMNFLLEKNKMSRVPVYLVVALACLVAVGALVLLRLLTADVFLPYWREASVALATFTSTAATMKATGHAQNSANHKDITPATGAHASTVNTHATDALH